MSNTPSKAEIEALVKRHGATSYRNRADTQHPAYGFTEDGLNGLIDEVLEKWGTPQPSPAAQGDAIEHELAMLIRRIVSSARRNCQDESNVLKLANEAWAYLVRKGLVGSPLRDAGIESDVGTQAEDSVQEDAAQESQYRRGYRHGYEQRDAEVRGALA